MIYSTAAKTENKSVGLILLMSGLSKEPNWLGRAKVRLSSGVRIDPAFYLYVRKGKIVRSKIQSPLALRKLRKEILEKVLG